LCSNSTAHTAGDPHIGVHITRLTPCGKARDLHPTRHDMCRDLCGQCHREVSIIVDAGDAYTANILVYQLRPQRQGCARTTATAHPTPVLLSVWAAYGQAAAKPPHSQEPDLRHDLLCISIGGEMGKFGLMHCPSTVCHFPRVGTADARNQRPPLAALHRIFPDSWPACHFEQERGRD
jgi:hypothetical protein